MLVMVVVVGVPTSPPVVLVLVVHLLALGAALHGVHVGVRVGVHVGHGGGQLLQGGVRGLHAHHGLAQQVDGVRQRGQDELETLLRRTTRGSGESWKSARGTAVILYSAIIIIIRRRKYGCTNTDTSIRSE